MYFPWATFADGWCLQLQNEIQRTIEREKDQLFEPDPRFAHCKLSDEQKRHFITNGFVQVKRSFQAILHDEAYMQLIVILGPGCCSERALG